MQRLMAMMLLSGAAGETELYKSVLHADDECGTGPGSEAGCSWNALQTRVALEASAHHERLIDDQNQSFGPLFGGSSATTSKYIARCFGKVGGDCKHVSGGRCVCVDGCMGADGNCYQAENRLIAQSVSFTNAKWKGYQMYMKRLSASGMISTTRSPEWANGGQDKFNIYQLPGRHGGQTEYFIASQKWPDNVVAIQATGIWAKMTRWSLYGAYATDLNKFHHPWDITTLMLRLCSLRSRGRPDAVMIGTGVETGGTSIWAYVKDKSYKVYGYWLPEKMALATALNRTMPDVFKGNDPGEGGYWIPKPPIPSGVLPDC